MTSSCDSSVCSPDMSTLSEELNLVYRLLSMPLFSPLVSSDAQHLTLLGIATLYSSFIVIQYFYGSSAQLQPQALTAATPGPGSASTSNLSEEDYNIGIGIVSQAIWTQKRIAYILREDIALPQSVSRNLCIRIKVSNAISNTSLRRYLLFR